MSLLAWYPLLSNTNNQGLDGTNLTNMGSVGYTAGNMGNAATFTGSSTKCLHRAYFSSLTNNFSCCCWFKNTTVNTNNQFIISQGRNVTQFGFNIVIINGSLQIWYGTGVTNKITVGTCSANTWYHLAVTVDSSGVRAYLNGELKATGAYSTPNYTQASSRFVIGKMSYSYSTTTDYFPFYGQVCDVRVYNHSLSYKEIKEISKGLMLHYTLRNSRMAGKNTTEYDCSGYKRNGSRSGITMSSSSGRNLNYHNFTANTSTVNVASCFTSGQQLKEFSISIWGKTTTLNSTAPNLVSLGENSFVRFRLASTTSIWYYIRIGSTMCSNTFSTSSITLTDGKWHHYALTFKNGYVYIYVDGKLIGTGNHSGTATYATCSSTAWHLGGYTANSENFIGGLSDFRLYCTCLNENDIKELFGTAGFIDKRGSFSAYEFIEQNSQPNLINKSGIQYITTLQEAVETCKVYKTNLLKSTHFYEI